MSLSSRRRTRQKVREKGKRSRRRDAVRGRPTLSRRSGVLLTALAVALVVGGGAVWKLLLRAPALRQAAAMVDPEERRLRDAVRQRPADPQAHGALGAYLLKQRRPYEALWAFQDAIDLDPKEKSRGIGPEAPSPRRLPEESEALRLQIARALIVAHLPRQALRFLARSYSSSHEPGDATARTPDLEERRVAAAAYLAMGDPVGAVGMLKAAGPALATSPKALLDLGNAYEVLGDDLAAEAAYRRHLEQAPDSLEGYLALARVGTRRQQWREALAALARARRLAPDDPRPLYQIALALEARGGPEAEIEADQLLGRLLASHPDYGPAHVRLGRRRLRQRRPVEALAHFEAARSAGAGGAEVRLHLAEALEATGRKAEAQYQRGVYYLETRQPHRALRAFERMALLDPGQPNAQVMIATAYAGMEEPASAAEAARRGLERHPDDPQLLSLCARMLAMADDRTAANHLCRRWIERYPEAAEPYFLLASMEREALRFREAARLAQQALARDADNAEYCLEAGRAFAALATPRDLRRAAAMLSRATALNPGDPKAPLQLAEVLLKLGDLEGARQQYQRGMDLDPGNRQGVVGLSQLCSRLGKGERVAFYSAIIRELQERADAARLLWRQVLRTPDDADAHARLAQRLLEAGDLKYARYELERVVELRPDQTVPARQLQVVERLLALRES